MWKSNWDETKQRFVKWWNREGLLIGMWGAPEVGRAVHEQVAAPVVPENLEERYTNAAFRAAENHYRLSRSVFPLDVLPSACTDLGPGSLALFLGSQPGFSESTVWYHPCIHEVEEPEELPPLRFDPANRWWQITEDVLRRCKEMAQGKYLVTCPDLVENMDTLSSLRDAQTLCVDMIERPEWVEQKIPEINRFGSTPTNGFTTSSRHRTAAPRLGRFVFGVRARWPRCSATPRQCFPPRCIASS